MVVRIDRQRDAAQPGEALRHRSLVVLGEEGGKQIEEGVFAEMVLQHLRGFVQGVRGPLRTLAG